MDLYDDSQEMKCKSLAEQMTRLMSDEEDIHNLLSQSFNWNYYKTEIKKDLELFEKSVPNNNRGRYCAYNKNLKARMDKVHKGRLSSIIIQCSNPSPTRVR